MAQQGQQSQNYQFWKNFGLQQQQVQAQAAQFAAQTAQLRQQIAIQQQQYDLARTAADKQANTPVTPQNNPIAAQQNQAINQYYDQQKQNNGLFSLGNINNSVIQPAADSWAT